MKNLALAAAFCAALLLAPVSGAQTPPTTAPPTTPPAAEAPAAPAPAPAPAAPSSAQPAETPASPPAHSCRTRKEVGEACACLRAPEQVGTVQAATDGGRNMCVVPTQ
jgi:hypothetical protein